MWLFAYPSLQLQIQIWIQIGSDAPASDSRGTKIYDLLVICLPHLSAILPHITVELLLWSSCNSMLEQFSPASYAELSSVSYNKTSSIASPPCYQIPHQASLLSFGFSHLSGSLLWNHLSTPALGCYNLLTFLDCYLHNIKGNHKLINLHKTVPLLPLYVNSFSFAGNHFPALIPLDGERNPLRAGSPFHFTKRIYNLKTV